MPSPFAETVSIGEPKENRSMSDKTTRMPRFRSESEEADCWASSAGRAYVKARLFSGKRLNHNFVHVAPSPVLAALIGANDGVTGLAEVLRRMFVLGRIAAPYVPALHAQAQMNPRIAGFYAVFTHVLVGARDLDLIQMRAFRRHEVLQR